jgi:hypothetical protein
VFPQVSTVVFETLAASQTQLIDKARFFAREAEARQALLEDARRGAEDLRREAETRRLLTEEVQQAAEARQTGMERPERQLFLTRLETVEMQEAALEAYIRLTHDDRLWKYVAPQVGVLFQHEPMPFHVLEHYLKVTYLAAPPTIRASSPRSVCIPARRPRWIWETSMRAR